MVVTADTDWADLTVQPYGLENRTVRGFRVLLEALARRLSTPRGGLFYDPRYGFDIRAFLNSRINDETKYNLVSGVENEVLQDPRVLGGTIELRTWTTGTAVTIELLMEIESTEGPWRGIITADTNTIILQAA
jgi:hypothetical protein